MFFCCGWYALEIFNYNLLPGHGSRAPRPHGVPTTSFEGHGGGSNHSTSTQTQRANFVRYEILCCQHRCSWTLAWRRLDHPYERPHRMLRLQLQNGKIGHSAFPELTILVVVARNKSIQLWLQPVTAVIRICTRHWRRRVKL